MKHITDKDFKKCVCIYSISNDVNNKIYIGSTINLYDRIRQHKYDFINRPNYTAKLYNDMKKIGIEHFYVNIIEEVSVITQTELHNLESYYIDKFDTINNGYNSRKDIDGKCIVNDNTRNKHKNDTKNAWLNDKHKDHDLKLSKFIYNIYDAKTNELLDADIMPRNITKKYKIPSSNIFQSIKKSIVKYNNGVYDETKTGYYTTKLYRVERIFRKNTTRDGINRIKGKDGKTVIVNF